MIHAQFTMRAVSLQMDTRVDVIIPEDRHQTKSIGDKKYPVLYVLHGMKEDSASWLNLSNIFLLCRDLDLIVVFPSANNSSYVNTQYGMNYYDWIVNELPVKLHNLLPITDDPKQTFIMGESMGGYGTMRIALSNPEKYGKAVCLSGGDMGAFMNFDDPLRRGNFGSREEYLNSDNNLYNLIEKLKDHNGDLPEFAFYCGTEDRAYANCSKLAETLEKEVPWVHVQKEFWPGLHNFFFWNQAIPKALKFFGFDVRENDVI